MWTKSYTVELFLICFLTLIPWRGPGVFKIICPRDSARVVRKIVQLKIMPVLEKYHVKMPLECPFHPLRDIFGPQQEAKQMNRATQWSCGFCGKSFFEEKFLDLHFENRHKSNINTAEDSVCLADYCDVMRCEVLISHDSSLVFGNLITDLEVWSESNQQTSITTSGPRDLAKLPPKSAMFLATVSSQKGPNLRNNNNINSRHNDKVDLNTGSKSKCDNRKNFTKKDNQVDEDDEEADDEEEDEDDDEESVSSSNNSCDKSNFVDSTLPPIVDKKQQRLSDMQRMKANCKPEELELLKIKCEVLVRDCIYGLLVNLSQQEFKEMEDEINRQICWYLSCDRYWEDVSPEPRSFPWALLLIIAIILSFGICLCYYIIWVLFESDDRKFFMMGSFSSQSLHDHASPMHSRAAMHQLLNNVDSQSFHSAEGFYSAGGYAMDDLGQSEHYIYVTYPPELKRRLLESCYNRTTRL